MDFADYARGVVIRFVEAHLRLMGKVEKNVEQQTGILESMNAELKHKERLLTEIMSNQREIKEKIQCPKPTPPNTTG